MGKKNRTEAFLVMKNGDRYKVVGENERYWLCEGTQFRKSNPNIMEIVKTKPAKEKVEE